ncbi:hypothetical protein FIBSPDRAFT_218485 [Athelia psychrophila]|uniref:Uncharacterized protein n=1 Tax=Athelia psychrophila TaxID=1759441 RepID=A0A165Z9H6_9AGAM|nr:hypothetical protein FIBSPDRAFT_218485 [Fibularhizoctonia sp. CBS 109695]
MNLLDETNPITCTVQTPSVINTRVCATSVPDAPALHKYSRYTPSSPSRSWNRRMRPTPNSSWCYEEHTHCAASHCTPERSRRAAQDQA